MAEEMRKCTVAETAEGLQAIGDESDTATAAHILETCVLRIFGHMLGPEDVCPVIGNKRPPDMQAP